MEYGQLCPLAIYGRNTIHPAVLANIGTALASGYSMTGLPESQAASLASLRSSLRSVKTREGTTLSVKAECLSSLRMHRRLLRAWTDYWSIRKCHRCCIFRPILTRFAAPALPPFARHQTYVRH
jgi:hypothetical protein